MVRLRIVGELYVLLEPSLNLDLVKRLGTDFGVEAQPVLSTYRWLLSSLWLDPMLKVEATRARRLTRPYLPHVLGGEEHMTISGALTAQRDGFDGIIHAYPLTCMPENICRTVLPNIIEKMDLPMLPALLRRTHFTGGGEHQAGGLHRHASRSQKGSGVRRRHQSREVDGVKKVKRWRWKRLKAA